MRFDAKFPEEVLYKDLPDPHLRFDQITNRFVLLKDLVTPEITVPAGEYTDGASVPKMLSNIVSPYDRHMVACIVHDYMYRKALVLPGYEDDPKKGADDLFAVNLMRCNHLFGFEFTLITPMVTAVRMFGRGAYGGECAYAV